MNFFILGAVILGQLPYHFLRLLATSANPMADRLPTRNYGSSKGGRPSGVVSLLPSLS